MFSRLVSSLLSSVSDRLNFSQLMSSHVCSPFLILSPQLFSQFCRGVFLFPEPLQQLRFSTSEGKSRVSSTRSARRLNSTQLVSTQLFTALLKSSQLISSLFISYHLLAANLSSSQRIPPHPSASQLVSAPFSSSSVSMMIIIKLMFNCLTAPKEKQQNKTKQENLTEGQRLKAVSTS